MAVLNLRTVDDEIANRIRASAFARGMNLSDYVASLERLRIAIVEGKGGKQALKELGLEPKTV